MDNNTLIMELLPLVKFLQLEVATLKSEAKFSTIEATLLQNDSTDSGKDQQMRSGFGRQTLPQQRINSSCHQGPGPHSWRWPSNQDECSIQEEKNGEAWASVDQKRGSDQDYPLLN